MNFVKYFMIVGSVSFFLISCKKERPNIVPSQKEHLVRYIEVEEFAAKKGAKRFSAVTRSPEFGDLSFQVGGRIERLHVGIGSSFSQGSIIAELEDKDFKLRLKEAEAAEKATKARYDNAQKEYERTRKLFDANVVSQSEYDRALASMDGSKGNYEASIQRVALRKRELAYTKLIARADGTITDTLVKAGEVVNLGRPVVRFDSNKNQEVRFSVAEQFVGKLELGQNIKVVLSAFPGVEFEAEITELGNTATSAASNFPVVAAFKNRNQGIRSGMSAQACVLLDQQDVVRVPPEALSSDSKGHYVFRIKSKGGESVAEKVSVEIGAVDSIGIVILEGVLPGNKLVTAGLSKLHDGAVVKLK